ncbi:hypothetical protein ACHAXS_008253 [Conticribra weissflogii]
MSHICTTRHTSDPHPKEPLKLWHSTCEHKTKSNYLQIKHHRELFLLALYDKNVLLKMMADIAKNTHDTRGSVFQATRQVRDCTCSQCLGLLKE